MNCEKMFDIMPMLINGSLDRAEEKAALEHLMECDECRRELAFWTRVADAHKSFEGEFTASDKDKIYQALTRRPSTAWDVTKQAVKVYFKVIESILNI